MKTLISSNGCCYSDTAKLRRFQKNVSILFIFFNALFSGVALAFTEGQHVTTLLEGCRNNGSITLPINGQFVCPDSAYTNGNLGKSWNELDLVPHRLTTSLGNQKDATTNYNLVVTGDGIINSKVGWDVVSVPVVNTAKSDASCSISAGEQLKLGTQAFTFQVRQDASSTTEGSVLETQVADVTNGGNLEFAILPIPDSVYQLCEVVMPGWSTNLNNSPNVLFVPNSIISPTLPNPSVNNMTVCVDFKVGAGETKSFAVDNAPPQGGRGLTIGFWKNWASCANSKGGQKPVLDQTMAKATPLGIKVGNFYLIGDPSNENLAPDCSKAVSLLNKSTFRGKKMASDPLFNMTAQLVAAELNLSAGAYTCPNVVTSIANANNLLIKYSFTGNGYTGKLSASDTTTANNLATFLDNYNNNRTGVCQ